MQTVPVTVTPIQASPQNPLPSVRLGVQTSKQRRLEADINTVLAGSAKNARSSYRLNWEGGKVPRGAVVGGHSITWTQNGQVIANNKAIGTYKRTVEFGGPSGTSQEMIVYLT